MTVSPAQLDAFLARMDARRKREEAEIPQETEEQRIERTGNTVMTIGTGKGPRLVK